MFHISLVISSLCKRCIGCLKLEDRERGEEDRGLKSKGRNEEKHGVRLSLGCPLLFLLQLFFDLKENEEVHDPSQKTYTSLLFKRLRASMEISEATHFDESHLKASLFERLKNFEKEDNYILPLLIDMPYEILVEDERHVLLRDLVLSNVMVSCYALSGLRVGEAFEVFDLMQFAGVQWGHEDGKESMKFLMKMIIRDFEQDELTLASVLSSCANSSAISAIGLVHAYGKCKIHGNVRLAKWAADNMLDVKEPVIDILISNIYASMRHLIEKARVRKMMRDRCDYMVLSCSWMEIAGEIHIFVSKRNIHAVLGMLG
ncbi:hypothetical protein HHK36_001179 [Tetracentron sinense]|uniref:Pentatricopeptide repeat-containing protein n=1 Tax=Tetracentron sinense TaxID=13715 RepID=A0A835DQS3_TETSI|nr:hypothetical protein HHK36_001179 [Tetracentron sinense]